MARPFKFSQEATLEKIMDVFWAEGYEGTSLSKLVAATGLQKASLYGMFGDKRSMFCHAIAEYDSRHVEGSITAMGFLSGKAALETLLMAPALAVQSGDIRGCLLCNTSSEISQLDPKSVQLVKLGQGKMLTAIEDALLRLNDSSLEEATCFQDRQERQTKAREILALYFGLWVLARSGENEESLKAIGQSALASVKLRSLQSA